MPFRVNTNTDALQAYYQLAKVNAETTKAQMRLSSGKRIMSVADDTSGFNVGTSLKGKVAVMKGAQSNISAAKNMLSTAEGGLLGINDLLTKIEGKLSDATNPTNDRNALASDIKALSEEIKSILTNTKFNNAQLLSGSDVAAGDKFRFQVGEFSDNLDLDFAVNLASSGAATGGTDVSSELDKFTGVVLGSLTNTTGVGALNTALSNIKTEVTDSLGKIGNMVQRLDIKDETLNTSIANAESSISRLFDADMAMEQLNATRGSILQQAGTAMLAQLNMAPQQVLQLFG